MVMLQAAAADYLVVWYKSKRKRFREITAASDQFNDIPEAVLSALSCAYFVTKSAC